MSLLSPPAWIARPIAAVVIAAMVTTQTYAAWADNITRGANQAQAAGQSLPKPGDLFQTDGAGNISLWPNSTKPTTLKSGDLFPGSNGQNNDALKGLYGDNNALLNAGATANTTLKTEQSRTGDAYRTLIGTSRVSRPNLDNDPIWKKTDETYAKEEDLAKGFADCSKNTTYTPGTTSAHIPDYKTCERINDQTRSCKLTHTYRPGVLDHSSGPLNVGSCGDGCTEIWLGQVGDNYYSGWCSIFEESIEVNVFNPDAVIDAKLVYAKWDDYMQVWIDGTKVWSGPDGSFPPETAGACERKTSWTANPNVDVTGYFKKTGKLNFKTRTSVSGEGEGYAKIQIRYDPNKILYKDEWSPADCTESAKGLSDGFCTGSFTCTDSPPLDADGCAVVNGIKLCASNFPTRFNGLSPLCRNATVNANCNFYKGQMDCWTDPQGQKHCPITSGENMESCAQYETNPKCGFISSNCVQGALGASGQCYVREEKWDCGGDVNVKTYTSSTQFSCPGPVRCMGTECVNPTKESSTDFASAVAALQAAHFMAMDADCNAETNEADRNCTIFKGKPATCKKAVGGVVDCCKEPEGVSLGDYITLVTSISKLTGATEFLEESNPIRGAWETLSQPFEDAWMEINKPFVQGWENLWGGAESVGSDEVSKTLLQTVQEDLMEQVGEWTYEAFGEEAANMLFSRVTEAGTEVAAYAAEGAVEGTLQLGGATAMVGSMLSVIGWAYMVYQIVMTLIKIIYACEKEEFELGAQRALKNCHQVGSYCAQSFGTCIEKIESYCCFNSPLSRILQEQVRGQLGRSWGTPKTPDCGGLMATDLTNVDWSKVDLSEWMGLLSSTGHMPDVNSIDLERLTGSGSQLNTGTRMDAAERAIERVGSTNVTTVRSKATTQLLNKNY